MILNQCSTCSDCDSCTKSFCTAWLVSSRERRLITWLRHSKHCCCNTACKIQRDVNYFISKFNHIQLYTPRCRPTFSWMWDLFSFWRWASATRRPCTSTRHSCSSASSCTHRWNNGYVLTGILAYCIVYTLNSIWNSYTLYNSTRLHCWHMVSLSHIYERERERELYPTGYNGAEVQTCTWGFVIQKMSWRTDLIGRGKDFWIPASPTRNNAKELKTGNAYLFPLDLYAVRLYCQAGELDWEREKF